MKSSQQFFFLLLFSFENKGSILLSSLPSPTTFVDWYYSIFLLLTHHETIWLLIGRNKTKVKAEEWMDEERQSIGWAENNIV